MLKIAAVLSFAVHVVDSSSSSHSDMFEEFVKTYGRKYAPEEKKSRFEIFQANLRKIEASNAKNKSYTLGVTPFADLTREEFRARVRGGISRSARLAAQKQENMTKFKMPAGFKVPDSVDWVPKGVVTAVKDQGHCGSCWIFSATGALEAAMALAGHKLVSLSEQEILDCDKGRFSPLIGHGCYGGMENQAMGWVKSWGICAEEDYKYRCANMSSEECTSSKCAKDRCTPVLKGSPGFMSHSGDVEGYHQVDSYQDGATKLAALEAAVAKQPISAGIEADSDTFQLYKSGIIDDDDCCEFPNCENDHGILIVGYGVENGKKYWKIKNSWGSDYGESGYVRIERASPDEPQFGECGIRQSGAYFPTVKPPSDDKVVV